MDCDELDEVLSVEEQDYVVKEVEIIAGRITKQTSETNLIEIVGKYYKNRVG